MAYAVTDDVLARAGHVQGAFTIAGKRPNLADLAKFLDDTAAEIDAAIRARGFDPAMLTTDEAAAFVDLNAYGALYRGLAGLNDSSPPVQQALSQARSVWEDAMGTPSSKGSIAAGTFAAIRALEAGVGGGGQGANAGCFWGEEPQYGSRASVMTEADQLRDTNLAADFSREMPG